jgi:hypothetical protein
MKGSIMLKTLLKRARIPAAIGAVTLASQSAFAALPTVVNTAVTDGTADGK